METSKLKEIADTLELPTSSGIIAGIQERSQQLNQFLTIPLVGEFSSGKTTLLNTLVNSRLETNFSPTTATLFEIRFSSPQEKAVVFKDDDTSYEISDVSSIKNVDLTNVALIQVYDTSEKLSASIVLTDTPGLSSNEQKHLTRLTGYLPSADAILLVIDVNQGVTDSMLRFIKIAELAKKRMYAVITKCETKTKPEQEKIKQYIKSNIQIPLEKIICVSSQENEIGELLEVLNEIQQNKNQIIIEVTNLRLEAIRQDLLEYVTKLLNSSELSTIDLDKKIADEKQKLQVLNSSIDRLISSLRNEADGLSLRAITDFNRRIFNELEAVVMNPPASNINNLVASRIQSVASLLFQNFKNDILRELNTLLQKYQSDRNNIPLPALESFGLQKYSLEQFSYNIDLELPQMQNLNRNIAIGAKFVAAAALVAVSVVTAGGALIAVGSVGAGTVATVFGTGGAGAALAKNAVNAVKVAAPVIDTVTDIASINSNRRIIKDREKLSKEVTEKYNEVEKYDYEAADKAANLGRKRGFVENVVSKITEGAIAKPQRKKIIDDYIMDNLQPEFRSQIQRISDEMVSNIGEVIYGEVKEHTSAMQKSLEKLKTAKQNEKSVYDEKIKLWKAYQKELG